MLRAVTCLWLVAVIHLVALMMVSVVQQFMVTQLGQRDLELRMMLVDVARAASDQGSSEGALQMLFGGSEDLDAHDHDDVTVIRHKRQLAFDNILSDLLKAQENVLAAHCSNKTRTCAQGPKGDKGTNGHRGPAGVKGEKGDRGLLGVAGRPGVRGQAGDGGDRGMPGETGLTGKAGLRGPPGDKGSRGHQGDQGATGQAGLTGLRGDRGFLGATGKAGFVGPQGGRGQQGPKGQPGGQGGRGGQGHVGLPGDPGQQLGAGCECLKAPHVTHLPAAKQVQLNAALSIQCRADGNPPPKVTWSRGHTNILHFDHVILSDLGTYTCKAKNPFGTDTKAVKLHT